VPDIDNVPDLHDNPADAKLVLFIGGNQFFVLLQLIARFEALHPALKGKIFYETLPPEILRKQIDAGGVVTLGNLTLSVRPDVYEAGPQALHTMQTQGQIESVVEYATNTLAIMVPASNPKRIASLNDLRRPEVRLSMPNPAWEGIAKQIAETLRKAGGDGLYQAVYQKKVKDGTSVLTEIHHRQTPMRILDGKADAGVVWASEVTFQEQIGNPITGVPIPETQNMTAIYAVGMLTDAPHADVARQWLTYLTSAPAQAVYRHFGFKPLEKRGK
jgi:ABC-type molybdate transport system substrate-binding protein